LKSVDLSADSRIARDQSAVTQSQGSTGAAEASSADSAREMNVAKLPKISPSQLRAEQSEENEDEPLSDIDSDTLRQLKRNASAAKPGKAEPDLSTNYSAAQDPSVTNDASAKGGLTPSAPNSIQSFAGLDDSDSLDGFLHTPPDTNIAAGPNHVMVVVNSMFAIYTKTGTKVSQSSLSSWFANVCTSCSVFDPRITYDSAGGHWIMIALYRDTVSQSKILVSISQTSDPTASWWNYSIDGVLNYLGENTWSDYPDVGFDGIAAGSGGAIYLTTNQFTFGTSPSFRTAVLYILPKSSLYAGLGISFWRAWDRKNGDSSQAFTYRASKTYGDPGGEFLINTENNGSSVSLWRVNPTFPPNAVDWTLQSSVNIGSYSVAPFATQPGTTDLIDTMDNRMFNAVWQNNRIYAGFTDAHNWGSGTVAALHYLKINTSSNAAEINSIFGADGLHYYSPAIATDSSDNIVLVFSRSNASEFAGPRYTGQMTTESSPEASAQLKAGTTALFQRPGTTSNRWGDYQGAAIDPSDGSKVWIYGEWADDLPGINNDYDWGTWIGQTQFPGTTPTPPGAPTATSATGMTGNSFTANWSSSSGASGYRLDVSTNSSFSSFVTGFQDLDVGDVLGRTVTGLSANTTYFYRVRAYNSAGTSSSSNTISVTTTSSGSGGLVINATFDSSITSNPNAAAIQSMINRAISIYQSTFSDPITISICFRYASTEINGNPLPSGVLARSNSAPALVPWNTYINALKSDGKSTNDSTANAGLPTSPLSSSILITTANGRAVGLNTPPGTFIGVPAGSYDGVVTLNSTFSQLQFSRPISGSNLDAQSATEHEMDEVIGLGSYLNTNGTDLRPQDLFSWSSAGTRSLTTSGLRYFSINGGTTRIVGFNQGGGDFGDWADGTCFVQQAIVCAGASPDISATSPEGINLDVIGYDLGGTSGGAPAAPTANAATNITSSGFTANWNSSSGATGYRLDVSTSSAFSTFVSGFQDLDVGNVLTRTVTGLNAGTTYFYRLRAYNAGGTSGNSATISLTTAVSAPAAPTANAASNITSTGFTANWSSSSVATGYRLDVSTVNTFSSFVSGFQDLDLGNVLSRSVSGLSAATTYFYRVRAYNTGGTSGNSGIISVTTTVGAPSVPTANAATNVTNTGFTANWSSSSGATGYRLDVSAVNTFGSFVSGFQNLDVGNVVSRNVTGLNSGTTYFYRVRAYNGGGTSTNSGTISLTTTSPTVQVTIQTNPIGRTFTIDGSTFSTTQTLSWTTGSSHTISTTSPQSGTTGMQFVWSSWSDGGAISHSATPSSNTTYTANFTTQFLLTMNAGTGGTVSPASAFFNSGQSVNISATPNAGFSFSSWSGTGTGSFSGATNPASVTMNGPITETASFVAIPKTIQLSAPSYSIGEGGQILNVNVTRGGDATAAASVSFATSDGAGLQNCNVANGKASSRCDYISTLGTINFAAGEVSKTIPILIVDDSYAEGDEVFNITLTNPLGASLGAQALATITIKDNESTSGVNQIDLAGFFVNEHYFDFLNRQPDASGLAFWTNEITLCGSNQACIELKRVNVSAAYFLSIEFQQTGYLVERVYKAAYGDAIGNSTFGGSHTLAVPIVRLNEFLPDTQEISKGVVVGQAGWEQAIENNKVAFTSEFVQRSRFTSAYATSLTPTQFVDRLFANTGVSPSPTDRSAAINEFGIALNTADVAARARALRRVAENATLSTNEFNRAFVLMQFFGYLRRNPNDPQDTDYSGYDFWLTKLNQFNGNFANADMVKAFITSGEYRQRFGP